MQNQKYIRLQSKYVNNFLTGIFGRYHKISHQIVQIILAFLFCSPFRHKTLFVLKEGTLSVKFSHQLGGQSKVNLFVMSNPNQQIVASKQKITIKQNDQLIIANKHYHNERIKVSKIWTRPATQTQKKILTYCGRFKQFLLGKHHQNKTIDLRYLNRQFMVSFFYKDQFHRHLKNIEENEANFCSFDVLDSYMSLVTKNYIEIEVQSSEFSDRNEKMYKIMVEGSDSELLQGVSLIYDSQQKKWQFFGEDLVIWKEENVFSRKKLLIRTVDGKVDLVEGNNMRSVAQFQLMFQQEDQKEKKF